MGLYGYGFIVRIGAGDLFYVCLVCFIYVSRLWLFVLEVIPCLLYKGANSALSRTFFLQAFPNKQQAVDSLQYTELISEHFSLTSTSS
jgi:hypothetical protein